MMKLPDPHRHLRRNIDPIAAPPDDSHLDLLIQGSKREGSTVQCPGVGTAPGTFALDDGKHLKIDRHLWRGVAEQASTDTAAGLRTA